MADTLTLTGTATATLVGNWELRAGSQDTTEWLGGQGAAYVEGTSGYPGSLTPFGASNDGGAAQGYDAAPKLALINVTGGADGETIILGGSGIAPTAILSVMATDAGTAAVAVGASFTGLTINLQYLSGSANVTTVMVLYN
tara:strand:+ start:42 stop:464 length:423 start_codon:yes stop_codon:yes gene_type:complete